MPLIHRHILFHKHRKNRNKFQYQLEIAVAFLGFFKWPFQRIERWGFRTAHSALDARQQVAKRPITWAMLIGKEPLHVRQFHGRQL